MRAVIFVNGLVEDLANLARFVQEDDYLIGADGGTLHALNIDRIPYVVVGDMDSIPPSIQRELRDQEVQFEKHRPEKNQTDLELAVERAIADGATSIVLVGVLGGRLDQTLANLLLLAQREWPVPISIVDSLNDREQQAQLVRPNQPLHLRGKIGTTVSALPLSERVTGITYSGLKYPLTDATLPFGSTHGISNELVASPATIEIGTGALLVVWLHNA